MPIFSQTVNDPTAVSPYTITPNDPNNPTGGSTVSQPSDDAKYQKAGQDAAARWGLKFVNAQLEVVNGKPTGNLIVQVQNSNGLAGVINIDSSGNASTPQEEGTGNPLPMPSPSTTTGTGAQITTAAAATTNAASGAQNANTNQQNAASKDEYTKNVGGVIMWHHEDPQNKGSFIDSPIGMANPTNPADTAPKDVGGTRFEYVQPVMDDKGNPKPGTGTWVNKGVSPAAPMTAYEQENLKLTQAKDAADASAQKATQEQQDVANKLKAQLDAADNKYKDWQSWAASETDARAWYEDQLKEVNDQGTQAISRANLALQAQQSAQSAWYQYAQNQNAQQNTALQAARDLEQNRTNTANEANAKGALGAGMLKDRASNATGLLNNWMGQISGNKNFGTGSASIAGLGQGLANDALGFSTQAMGGQNIMDEAAKMVHAANPDLNGTPEGAGYTALLSQMMERLANPNGQPTQLAKNATEPQTDQSTAIANAVNQVPPQIAPPTTTPPPSGTPSDAATNAPTPPSVVQPPQPQQQPATVIPPQQNVDLNGNVTVNSLPTFNPTLMNNNQPR